MMGAITQTFTWSKPYLLEASTWSHGLAYGNIKGWGITNSHFGGSHATVHMDPLVGWGGMVWTTFHVATNKIKKQWKACTPLLVNNGYMLQHVIQLPIFPAKLMTNHGRRDMAAIVEDSPLEHSDWWESLNKNTLMILLIYCLYTVNNG